MIRRFIAILVSTLVTIGIVGAAPSVASAPTMAVTWYGYGSPNYTSPTNHNAFERGPPAKSFDPVVSLAVDNPSYGISSRPSRSTIDATYDYDGTRRLVQVDNSLGTATGRTQASGGDLVAIPPSGVAAKSGPLIKAGTEGGETAGKAFPKSVKNDVLADNPSTCVYCRMETSAPQVDHAIPRARGGNATLDNAQTTCGWCNASKGSRDYPVNPPPFFRGSWPPQWWGGGG